MASNSTANSEHAFVPRENTMTVVFTSIEEAERAMSALLNLGIPPDEVELVTGADHQFPDIESPGFKQDTPGVEGFDEILHVVTESSSDDEKAYVEFDRVLAAGGVLLSLSRTGRQDRRTEFVSILRSCGARSIYYWGVLATERL